MSHRTAPYLRLVPPSAPDPNPLNVADVKHLPSGWTHIEVWRHGDLVSVVEARTDGLDPNFVRGIAAFWLGDRDAVIVHDAAERTGT